MPNWSGLLNEITKNGSTQDLVRRKYLKKLDQLTHRNVIAYYSGWLQKPTAPNYFINDSDKNGFMNAVYKLDPSRGLDLILHTPGGETAATESIVDYLRSKFSKNIRVIVPQLAMSGGTMIACAAKEIIMGKQSSLGPIDPQLGGVSCSGVIEEFDRAIKEVEENTKKALIWQQIVAKYPISFVGDCQKSIAWSKSMTKEWLKTGMFNGESSPAILSRIDKILEGLDNKSTLSHSRHLSATKCKDIGFNDKITLMESNQQLQDAILSVHHAFMLTFEQTPAIKIIENSKDNAYIQSLQAFILNKPN
jgi:hypothetical protein